MLATLQSGFSTQIHLLSRTIFKVATINLSFLHEDKRQHREVKEPAKGHTAANRWSQDPPRAVAGPFQQQLLSTGCVPSQLQGTRSRGPPGLSAGADCGLSGDLHEFRSECSDHWRFYLFLYTIYSQKTHWVPGPPQAICHFISNPRALLGCSVAKSHPTLCDPTGCSTPDFPVLHCLPEFAQTHVL